MWLETKGINIKTSSRVMFKGDFSSVHFTCNLNLSIGLVFHALNSFNYSLFHIESFTANVSQQLLLLCFPYALVLSKLTLYFIFQCFVYSHQLCLAYHLTEKSHTTQWPKQSISGPNSSRNVKNFVPRS
uniref:Uncharacterized protein n=1 Tax=Cacopsylla melanoneura TaxID=428564 RepID=A0A8D8T1G1_9HEMI